MESYGTIRLASRDQDYFPTTKRNDILFIASKSNQSILMGTASNTSAPLQITRSNVILTNLLLSNDVLPVTDFGVSLGSSNKRFKDLYLSGNSIFLGSNVITSDPITRIVTFKTTTGQSNAAISASYIQLGSGTSAVNLLPNSDGSITFASATNPAASNMFNYSNLTVQTLTVSNIVLQTTITTSTGNIGVGVTNPIDRLQVNGNTRSTKFLASDVGSAAAPSYSWLWNTITGLYLPDYNKLSIVTNGSDRLTIDSRGNIGINTTTPSNLLDVAGTISTSNLIVNSNATIRSLTNSNAYIASLSNTLANISTINANTLFGSNATLSNITCINLTFSNLALSLFSTNNASITTLQSSNANFSNMSAINLQSSNVSFQNLSIPVLFTASNANIINLQGSNVAFSNSTHNSIVASNIFSSNLDITTFGRFRNAVAIGSTYTAAPSNGLAIQGNVGIGTTSNYGPLDVYAAGSNTAFISVSSLGSSTGLRLAPSQLRNINLYGWPAVISAIDDSNSAAHITFSTSSGATATSVERMRILNTGNIGIGTTVPSALLDVNGTTAVRGGLFSLNSFLSNVWVQSNVSSNMWVTNLFASNTVLSNVTVSQTGFFQNIFSSNNSFSNLTANLLTTSNIFSSNTTIISSIITNNTTSNLYVPVAATVISLTSSNNSFSNLTIASTANISTLNANQASISNLTVVSATTASNLTTNNISVASLLASTIPTLISSNITSSNVSASNITASNITIPTLSASNLNTSNLSVSTTARLSVGLVASLSASNLTVTSNAGINTLNSSNVSLSNLIISQSASFTTSNVTATRIGFTSGNNLAVCMSSDPTTGLLVGTNSFGYPRTILYTWSNATLTCINRAQNTAGFVGINTTEPQTNLDVNGIVNITSSLRVPTVLSTGTPDVNNPSYSFWGNTTVGMFSPGTNQLAFATNGKLSMFVDPNGSVGIGTSTASTFTYPLNVNGIIYATDNMFIASDIRKKENLQRIENALEKLEQINGYTYNILQNSSRHAGVIAQEVEMVLPEVVSTDIDGYKSVAYGNLVALIINALKEVAQDVKDLKAKISPTFT